MPPEKMQKKANVKMKDMANPFARMPQAAPAPAPKAAPKKKKTSMVDTIGGSLKYVGDYLRGVKGKK